MGWGKLGGMGKCCKLPHHRALEANAFDMPDAQDITYLRINRCFKFSCSSHIVTNRSYFL